MRGLEECEDCIHGEVCKWKKRVEGINRSPDGPSVRIVGCVEKEVRE